MKKYIVLVSSKHPAVGERPSELEIDARNAREAVSEARRQVWASGHTRQDGPVLYRALRVLA